MFILYPCTPDARRPRFYIRSLRTTRITYLYQYTCTYAYIYTHARLLGGGVPRVCFARVAPTDFPQLAAENRPRRRAYCSRTPTGTRGISELRARTPLPPTRRFTMRVARRQRARTAPLIKLTRGARSHKTTRAGACSMLYGVFRSSLRYIPEMLGCVSENGKC